MKRWRRTKLSWQNTKTGWSCGNTPKKSSARTTRARCHLSWTLKNRRPGKDNSSISSERPTQTRRKKRSRSFGSTTIGPDHAHPHTLADSTSSSLITTYRTTFSTQNTSQSVSQYPTKKSARYDNDDQPRFKSQLPNITVPTLAHIATLSYRLWKPWPKYQVGPFNTIQTFAKAMFLIMTLFCVLFHCSNTKLKVDSLVDILAFFPRHLSAQLDESMYVHLSRLNSSLCKCFGFQREDPFEMAWLLDCFGQ